MAKAKSKSKPPPRKPRPRAAAKEGARERPLRLRVLPLTPARWADFVKLFGPRGACAGCWCMWWRVPRKQWGSQSGDGNRRAMKRIVDSGEVPGLLAYAGREPVGWCSIAPRRVFSVLERSRTLRPLDEQPVWSVVCFFVARPYRRKGVTRALLEAGLEYARKRGAPAVEGYPIEPSAKYPDAYAFTGIASSFRRAGFEEAARPSRTRRIMRRSLR